MELNLYVFDSSITPLGVIDVVTALTWEEKFADAGNFELWCPLNDQNAELLQEDNLLWTGGESAGVIEFKELTSDEEGTETIHIQGRLAESYLDYRTIYPTVSMTGKISDILRKQVENNLINPTDPARKIPNIKLASDQVAYGDSVSYQKTGDTVLLEASRLCEANSLGFRVQFLPRQHKFVFRVYQGTDRTLDQSVVNPVLFSSDLDDILESNYSHNKSELRNFAYVAGEDSGANRKIQTTCSGKSALELKGFTLLEYIQATGNQYTDLSVPATVNTKLVCDISYDSVYGDDYDWFVGNRETSVNWLLGYCGGKGCFWNDSYGYDYAGILSLNERTVLTLDLKNLEFSSINEKKTINSIVPSTGNIRLFIGNGSGFYKSSKCKCFSVSIYENNSLTHELVPVVQDSTKIPGLYDIIGDRFYSSLTGTPFVSGPVSQEAILSGLSRRELFVDARDLQSKRTDGTTIPEAEYNSMLIERGKTSLEDYKDIESFSATLRTFGVTGYVFGVDFFLGDKVTVYDSRLRVRTNAVVTSVLTTYDEDGERMDITFGYEQPTIANKLRRRM